jgi:hypothetical protein
VLCEELGISDVHLLLLLLLLGIMLLWLLLLLLPCHPSGAV